MSVTALTLSAYILSISGSVQETEYKMSDKQSTDVVVNFQEKNIPFRHKAWMINPASVCANQNRNSLVYSDCTVSAKKLFEQICTALTNSHSRYWHHQKYKVMYCDAAVNYKPLVATISYGNAPEMTQSEKQCNEAILKAMVSGSKADHEEKKQLCSKVN